MRTVCLSQTLQWSRQHKYKTRDISTVDCVIPRWAKCYVLTVEPFAVQYWALSIVLASPAGLASLHRSTVQSIFPYMVNGHAECTSVESWFNSPRRRVATPPFSYLGMIIWLCHTWPRSSVNKSVYVLYKVWSIYV